ncbi:LacI family transcriptional regulator [bacterium]|nr:MAG: LacI family transcriptional regulator [bacterium]
MATDSRKRQAKREDGRPKTATLADVAKVAGVTSMTVSRVIKGSGYVAPATREVVLRAAQELNYTANLAARALVTGRTGAIAIISGDLNLPYCANIVYLFDSLLSASGYQIHLLHTRGELRDLINSTNSASVDGVIVAGMHHFFEELSSLDRHVIPPCVHVGITKPSQGDYVHVDLRPAVEEALERMLAAGRKRIALVGVGSHLSVDETEIRPQTYISMMQNAGRELEFVSASPRYEVPGPERVNIIKQYIEANGCPDGLLCFNDDIAIQTYRALMDLGYRIPEDVLLVGCDGLPILQYFEPPLSTIAQPMEEMCALAWKFLQNRIATPDAPPQCTNFDAQLIVRKSLQN